MTDRKSPASGIDDYLDTLTETEREAVNAASVALDIAGLAYRARVTRGLTQTQAADVSGLKQQSISRIEGGTINVTVRMLERYLRALGFSLSMVICDEQTRGIIDQTTLNRSNDDADSHLAVSTRHHNNGALKRS